MFSYRFLCNRIEDVFLRVTVANSEAIIYTSLVFGWIYFVAWSVSFYPQIWVNFRRKSVVGLNFDFVFLNLLGFTLYSIFNCGLYWAPEIQAEYANRYPRGLNPVMLNDVVFSLHAVFATTVTIYQCFAYEVSYPHLLFLYNRITIAQCNNFSVSSLYF